MSALSSMPDAVASTEATPSVPEVLQTADANGRLLLQPRCGVGDHEAMRRLLTTLESEAQPDILSVTIDSYTRLLDLETAARLAQTAPERLNGYPLLTHGPLRGRELTESVAVPLEVRHGSPDGRLLFAATVASGITSYEGGGISYNLPYCKDVPLAHSLAAWHEVDAACGRLARQGLVIDRELFGSLTAVLVPPSLSLAVSFLEARLAADDGVRCLSIAYPQSGALAQDVAALHAIRQLAAVYLPPEVAVYPVLHEYMGPFPRDPAAADALILYGAITARLGRATKVVTKTNQEAHGVPTTAANAHALRTARLATSELLGFVSLEEDLVAEERSWIIREVAELVDPVLEGERLRDAIVDAFAAGRLDVPFSASVHARRAVVPARDSLGAIRYLDSGDLPFSEAVLDRNRRLLEDNRHATEMERIMSDINFFASCR